MQPYINRVSSLITGKENTELLYCYKDFPVFIGCTDSPVSTDVCADMNWNICKDSGMIQLNKLLPLDVVYSHYHSEAVGGVWKEHHEKFCDFIEEFRPKNIFEIGGSNGYIAKTYTERYPDARWTIVEPNPGFEGNSRIKVIEGFFEDHSDLSEFDAIIHSHVLEHFYDPNGPLSLISNNIAKDAVHLFSVPNLRSYLESKFTNTLNFEHTYFLTDYFVKYLVESYQFQINQVVDFKEHSTFYATSKNSGIDVPKLENHYNVYKHLFVEFVEYYHNEVDRLNDLINCFDGEVYLFGAHIFSQYLIHQGLNTKRIEKILDNSAQKNGKRLYGSNLIVSMPLEIRGKKSIAIILKAGQYQAEVKKQLLEINENITIWE